MADTLRTARDRTIARLSEAFAADQLALDDFDARLTVAHHSESEIELQQIVSDLPASASTAIALAPSAISASLVPAHKTLVAMMGGLQRKGAWTPARVTRVLTMMGGAELDFRDAQLAPGVTELHVFAMMGGVHIIVPPTLAIDIAGSALLGGFDHTDRAPVTADESRPLLRITGFAMLGGVHVETRLPGESAGEMRRRNRLERRAHRRAKKLAAPRD